MVALNTELVADLKHARRAAVPLVAVETPDPRQTAFTISEAVANGTKIWNWDLCRGILPLNDAAEGEALDPKFVKTSKQGPDAFFQACDQIPTDSVVVAHQAEAFFYGEPPRTAVTIQALQNLRDSYKQSKRMLCLLHGGVQIPERIRNDFIQLEEPLPTEEVLEAIIRQLDKDACNAKEGRKPVTDEVVSRCVEATRGLASAFLAEQVVAMALRPDGIDVDYAWKQKVAAIQQTQGLSVYRGGDTLSDLGGLEPIKQYLRLLFGGRKPPQAVVWLDEVEKTGLAARGDTSGVNQDQEGQLLTYLEDSNAYGVMLLGVPGAGKSQLCKAIAGEFGRLVIRIDLGAMQGGLVGQSQAQLRMALKIISAVGGDNVLWVATSNSVDGLSAAMRSRFIDTFFFDLPDGTEKDKIWDVWTKRQGLDGSVFCKPQDDGWAGRNIARCCQKAWMFDIPLQEAGRWIIPVGTLEAEEIKRLREQAHGRYLSASREGVYRMPKEKKGGGRKVEV